MAKPLTRIYLLRKELIIILNNIKNNNLPRDDK